MKIHVYVTPKKTVLDPQGQTIRRALNSMGHPEIENVRQGKFFDDLKKSLVKALTASREQRTWPKALDDLEGEGAIPILTTHKSKGLEYEIVVFVGLEDSAHFNSLDAEQICTFFVALSRAKRRIVFTYSGARPNLRGRVETQSRAAIAKLYEALAAQGVHPTPHVR